MAGKRLDPALLKETLDLVKRHGGISQAARAAGVVYQTFQSRHRAAVAAESTGELIGVDSLEDQEAIPKPFAFEREWKIWMNHIGMAKDRYAGPARPKVRNGRIRVVAAGDFHVPFHDKDAVAELIEREAPHTDILLIGGDFGDAHCASVFTKYEHISYEEEHAGKVLLLQELSSAFPIVKYLKGSNHTDRFEKRLRENLDKDMLDAIMSMTGGILNPDLALIKRYPNVEVSNWKTPNGEDVSWMEVIGDVAFTHAEKYSRVAGSALRSIEEWVDDFGGTLGLPKLSAIVQFHTHMQGQFPYKSDMVLIEPGCMCRVHSYQLGARISGRPQRVGYVVMDLIDGELDVDSIRVRWLNRKRKAA